MGLDRDELAARFAVETCGWSPEEKAEDVARKAVVFADSLLSALTPTPPPRESGTGAYVPKVGDVCKYVNDREGSDFVITLVTDGNVRWKRTGVAGATQVLSTWPEDIRFVRPATASERAAAGLPPAPVAERPTHVRVTGPSNVVLVTIGKVYPVVDWDAESQRLVIKNDLGERWLLSNLKPGDGTAAFPAWEPCPPPPPADARGEAWRTSVEGCGRCATSTWCCAARACLSESTPEGDPDVAERLALALARKAEGGAA